MVDYGSGPIKESIDNSVFIVPGIIIGALFAFFAYKLIKSLRDKEKNETRKKELKEKRKEKDQAKRTKKK